MGQTMATEATFTVPSDQFPLGTVFHQLPGVTIELERIIPAGDVVIPYFWVRGTEVDDIESEFTEHPGVRRFDSLTPSKTSICYASSGRWTTPTCSPY
jgi:hypothetical protein